MSVIRATNDANLIKLYSLLKSEQTQIVVIKKGIHQRTTKPHITARVVGVDTIHIWLSTDGGARFAWKAVGITATPGGAMMPPCVIQGVNRRGSVSYDVLTAERAAEAAYDASLASIAVSDQQTPPSPDRPSAVP
jgi:hypothetical protein